MCPFSTVFATLLKHIFSVDTVVNNRGEQGESEGLQFSSTTRKYQLIDRLTYLCTGKLDLYPCCDASA